MKIKSRLTKTSVNKYILVGCLAVILLFAIVVEVVIGMLFNMRFWDWLLLGAWLMFSMVHAYLFGMKLLG